MEKPDFTNNTASYFNENKYRGLNAITRAVLFWILFILLLFVLSSLLNSFFPAKWERYVYGIFGTIAAFTATWVFLKIEKRSFTDIGLVWELGTAFRFFKGIFTGAVIFMLIIIVLLVFTELQIERNTKTFDPWSAFWYLAIIPLALMEEVAFRSYPLLKLNTAFGLRITQIIVAVGFALYHVVGGWSVAGAFLGPGIWAFVFGLAAVWSGGIAVPTGIHVALNVLQSLTGLKAGSFESIWIMKHKEGLSDDLIAKTDTVGLITQLIVLVFAVMLTEYFILKKHKKKVNVI